MVDEDGVVIEEAATRPPMMPFMGLPLKLGLLLFAIGAILFVLVSSTMGEAIIIGTDIIVVAALRPLVARDLNGFDIWLVWLRMDLACLDTKAWGGASVSPNPIQEIGGKMSFQGVRRIIGMRLWKQPDFFGMTDNA